MHSHLRRFFQFKCTKTKIKTYQVAAALMSLVFIAENMAILRYFGEISNVFSTKLK
jgi:hypothetical protein